MGKDSDVVIVAGVRTAIGKFGGSLKDVRASQLAAHVMKTVIDRTGVSPDILDDVIVGECLQNFDEANTARTAALLAGFPVEIPATTIQRQCASSMQAVAFACQAIKAGDAGIIMVAGVESMSSAPYYMMKARWGFRLMHQELTDALWEALHSGSRILGQPMIMGETAENLAEKYNISREDQDQLALESHKKAEAAIKSGKFKEEIIPIEVKGPKGQKIVFEQDEHPRFGLKIEDLSKLPPVFRKNGTVTAGNSSGINDGAAAAIITTRKKARELNLEPMGRIVATAVAGVEPHLMGYGPVPATQKVLKKTGIKLQDIQLIELNEAFAAQYLACERALDIDRSITNVNGSGISLGHPVGCTGLRIIVSLLHEMKRRDLELGLATLCVGGGMGMATIIARD